MTFLRKNALLLFLAFLLPAGAMTLAFLANGIYWGGPVTVLAGDAYHQYVEIATLVSRILHSGGQQGFLYTWTSGLGLNLYAFASYYMGSFFLPLAYFFNAKSMPDFLYLTTLLKFGFIGLSSWISFSQMFRKINRWLLLAFSTSFALLSFLTSQNEIPMWQDVFILIPLIVWGLHRLQDEGKRILYYVTLSILFIQNYYFGFILAIFLVLYFLARSMWQGFKWRNFLNFAVTSLLSGLTSLVMLLPMYLDLKANGQAMTTAQSLFTENSWALDLVAKNFVGSYDTTQYQAVPMIYVGLLPLIFATLFFFVKSICLRVKIAYGVILAFVVASFYLEWLDLAWQGFHTPNMFLHRYAWVFSLMVILMALETFTRLREVKLVYILSVIGFWGVLFLVTFLIEHYHYLNGTLLAITLLFLAAYVILLLGVKKKWLGIRLFAPILILFAVVEVGVNTYYEIAGVKNQWNYPARSYYEQEASTLGSLADKVQALSKTTFVRTDNTSPDTANDSMKFGYNAIALFSSVRNANSSAVMSQLGFATDGGYLNLRYPGNTLLMDSVFGVGYNINLSQPAKFGFDTIPDSPAGLSHNSYAASLGIFVPGGYQDVHFLTSDALTNQTVFLNALTKTDRSYFTPFYALKTTTKAAIVNNLGRITLTQALGATGDLSVTYKVEVPAGVQAYLQLPDVTYNNPSVHNVTVTTPKYVYTVSTDSAGEYLNLGIFEKAQALTVMLTFPENTQVSYGSPAFWGLNLATYTQAMTDLAQNAVTAKTLKNGAELTTDTTASGDLFLTIPYDKGWQATVDGSKVTVKRAQSGFMKITLPKGKHTVVLHFWPAGLSAGIGLSLLGISLFVVSEWGRKWFQTRRASENEGIEIA
ncbi:MAG: YfhO family protein [Streptococcaceae bacterium]|jgi:uncharacterized membrane protein YfhO|nr:YfhO family protein [Streptococcaceae bacterium]